MQNCEIKCTRVDLSSELTGIEIHTLADLHIGDSSCDMNEIKKEIEIIKSNKNAYVVLNGDLMNNATKDSVSDSYSEQYTPMKQLEICVELLKPIKDKIIAITNGNHEIRTWKSTGIDLTRLIATELGLLDKYSPEGVMVYIRFGMNKKRKRKQWYSLYITHGSGGGRKEGGKANRLCEMASIIDADIYIHSHTHTPMIIKESFYRSDFLNSSVAKVEKLFVNTSSQLDYGGYGQRFEYKPGSKNNPVICLNGLKKEFKAIL